VIEGYPYHNAFFPCLYLAKLFRVGEKRVKVVRIKKKKNKSDFPLPSLSPSPYLYMNFWIAFLDMCIFSASLCFRALVLIQECVRIAWKAFPEICRGFKDFYFYSTDYRWDQGVYVL